VIGSITQVNVSAFNANLLVVLDAVLQERNATRAARRLHLTQSAVSNALARLRDQLGDPLLVRQGRGLTPTPFAVEIAPRVAAIVRELTAIVERDRRFDPRAEARTFTLACTDSQELSDVPRILRLFTRRLPRATLRIVSIDRLIMGDGLASGEVDVAISPSTIIVPPIQHHPLYVEEGVAVVRRNHPRVGRRLTRALFQQLAHVDVRVAGDQSPPHRAAEARLTQLGLRRQIAMVVPHFIAAATAVSQTDCLAALPRRFATAVARLLPLRLLPLPYPTPQLPISLAWHLRTDTTDVMRFFRALILEALR
jgi:DNA-binding transcriptional LysR family regulator